jgi:serine/threonine protein kinase
VTALPEKIGKYHIVGLAGHGNMGTVYVGYDPFADRDVAIKVCSVPDQVDEAAARMARKLFFNEAHTAGALDHPNILKVLDAGEEAGQPYIVMEYVEGGDTLDSYCTPETLLPTSQAAEYVARCAAALDYAHRRGVVHRDIKPTNIMLTRDGDVKIGDFGIAQSLRDDATHVLGMMGSPRYMSPEQIQDQALTVQTDLYSLGVVMFELLTGQPPFSSTSLPVLFRQITTDEAPALPALRPDLQPGLDSIVQCALEKELPYRYQTGAEFAADLSALFSDIRTAAHAHMDEGHRFEILREMGFFNDFSDSEVAEVADLASWSQVPAGGACSLPDQDPGFLLLINGDAELVSQGQAVASLAPGDGFGHMSAAHGRAQVRARNDATVLLMDARRLERCSESCQLRFNRALLHSMVRRLSVPAGLIADNDDAEPH